jgi:hypothetical protein
MKRMHALVVASDYCACVYSHFLMYYTQQQPILNANDAMYIKPQFTVADIGTYTCVVQNVVGTTLWEEALVALDK